MYIYIYILLYLQLTIEKILSRCRDTDPSVRIQAYKILRVKWEINSLHITERIEIVLLGLKDEYIYIIIISNIFIHHLIIF